MHVFVQKIIILCPHVGLHCRAEPGPCIQQSNSVCAPPRRVYPGRPVSSLGTGSGLWQTCWLWVICGHFFHWAKDISKRRVGQTKIWAQEVTVGTTYEPPGILGTSLETMSPPTSFGSLVQQEIMLPIGHWEEAVTHTSVQECLTLGNVSVNAVFALASFHLEAHKFLFVLIK